MLSSLSTMTNNDITAAQHPAAAADDGISPFRISVPRADLDYLRERLARTRWTADLPGTGWERGVPAAYLQDLATHWEKEYDWGRTRQPSTPIPSSSPP